MLLLLLLLQDGDGLAAKLGDALAKDKRVVLVEDFESGELKQWSQHKAGEFTDDARRGKKAYRFTATVGENTGGHLWKMLKPGHDRLHLRFYVKFPKDHDYLHHFVHLCGYNPPTAWPQGGAGELPDGGKRFSSGLEPWGDWGRNPAPGAWHFYSYWCEMKKAPDGKYWGNSFKPDKPVAVERDKWICAEFMIKCNTVGKADGEQAFWIDGKRAGRWEGIRWRTDESLNVNGVWLLYYVTDQWTKAKSMSVAFDDIVAATEYVGP